MHPALAQQIHSMVYVKALASELKAFELLVFFLIKWIVPATQSMENLTSETGFKLVKSVQGMPGIFGRRNAKHIILAASLLF